MKPDRRLLKRLQEQGKISPAEAKGAKEKTLDLLELENLFRLIGLPTPQTEYKFQAKPAYRLDYAWPEFKLAVEFDGGIWTGFGQGARRCPACKQPVRKHSGHTHPAAIIRDMEKANAANLAGWIYLRFTTDHLRNGKARDSLERAFRLIQEGAL